jgi:hypothetical protein
MKFVWLFTFLAFAYFVMAFLLTMGVINCFANLFVGVLIFALAGVICATIALALLAEED